MHGNFIATNTRIAEEVGVREQGSSHRSAACRRAYVGRGTGESVLDANIRRCRRSSSIARLVCRVVSAFGGGKRSWF